MEPEPGNQEFVNDLGWCRYEAGRLDETWRMFEQAMKMNTEDELA